MTEKKLIEMIEKMQQTSFSSDSSKSASWCAYREAEKLDDPSLLPVLCEIITDNNSENEKDVRRSAYFIMISLLEKAMIPQYCQFVIDMLEKETDKYVLESMLSCIGRKLKIPAEVDITPLIECTKSDEWLIRHSAISALRASNTEACREAVRSWVRQTDEKAYKYEIIYAISSLSIIGDMNDIELLEQHIHSRIRDIKGSALFAINCIQAKSNGI